MAFQAPTESYSGKIREVTLGSGTQVAVGGENTLPFYIFEGNVPNVPKIAMEVYDTEPVGWAEELKAVIGDVWNDPVAWAKKCESEFGADMICLQLAGTDPNGANKSVDEAVATVKAVLDAVSIPVMVYGSGNADKDAEVLKAVAEAAQGKNIVIGPAVEENYKSVAAAAMGFTAKVSGETPIDVNMAKQLNILMSNLGVPIDNLLVDPSAGALGYGLEYCFSVNERIKLAALTQNDNMLQSPTISNLGKETWKAKEAKISQEEAPEWGDQRKRGILWETVTAIATMLSGANILIMRHPESVRLIKQTIAGFGV
ncbi:MAG TPA: acetyl-CoA decarbonylase/synthase complex subunit delta [Anaerolineae bacterium]|jgi:acetyl-CoA decarbonylase/synthase complex subunit delta|nr:acetyl-CoA decarbonylase/synthase complex subunit delta [Anaerolineae bacterium]